MRALLALLTAMTLSACQGRPPTPMPTPATETARTTIAPVAQAASVDAYGPSASPVDRVSAEKSGFAVVELFGSEGCSSCPAADLALLRLEREDPRLIVLGFHVDYWNGSWRDRFSSEAITDRQRDYATTFRARGLYTPQAVIDGRAELVGSDESGVRAAIDRARSRPATVTLTTTIADVGERAIDVTVTASETPTTATKLTVAVTEDGITVTPTRGENAGASLDHVAVVRAFSSGAMTSNAITIRLDLPSDLRRERAHVIALAADEATRGIVGATRVGLAR
jgi:hypothetical protein